MATYVARRLLGMIPVAFFISLIAFGLLYLLPGDPAWMTPSTSSTLDGWETC